jgi:alpha-glucosidase
MYGTHPFYLDTRYYEVDSDKNTYTPITESANSAEKNYASYSHGVFLRNAHGQEVLLRQRNVTWRTLGGDIDLYFYAGPTQADVTKDYQTSTIGLPAMQQYFSLGYHQSRWGYESWNELRNVTSMFEQCNIPLETIWSDIDYMNQYRNFENDPVNFGYSEGQDFLDQLHESGRHYVPIVDAGIFDPTANNSTDM